jgi:hypothetical protein
MRFLLLAVALALASCASVQLDPQPAVATTHVPFNAQIGFNRISVPSESRLLAASVDGKPAFCTIQPAWFAIGEARRVCFTDDARSGYLSHYYVLGTLRSLTYDANIPYSLDPGGIAALQAVTPLSQHSMKAWPQVDVDWNKRSAGEGSNAATNDAISLREAAHGLPICAPTTVSDYCAKLNAERLAAEAAQVGIARKKQEAGKTLTAKESAILIKADADAATARMAAQAALAQAAAEQATYALQRQADELAYRQRLAACTAAADLVALSIRSFWGGIVAGVATGAACMQ